MIPGKSKICVNFFRPAGSFSQGTALCHTIKKQQNEKGGVAIETWGILGGDARTIWLIKMLIRQGMNVRACAVPGWEMSSLEETIHKSRALILPLPATRDGKTILGSGIRLDEELARQCEGKTVWAGQVSRLRRVWPGSEKLSLIDYGENESFVKENARLTAEGALALALTRHPGTLLGSRCLVAGYGRIGKKLSERLKAMGTGVFILARREESVKQAKEQGMCAGQTLPDTTFDIVCNTVPARLFPMNGGPLFAENGLYMELASAPGGAVAET